MSEITVYVDGVYDLFHAGHLAFLRKARAMGDRLIVGIHNDEDVARYKDPPVIFHEQRVAMLEACRLVDLVIPDAPLSTDEPFIERYGIDLVVHGDDNTYEEYFAVPLALGIMRYVSYTPGISTSEIYRRIVERGDRVA